LPLGKTSFPVKNKQTKSPTKPALAALFWAQLALKIEGRQPITVLWAMSEPKEMKGTWKAELSWGWRGVMNHGVKWASTWVKEVLRHQNWSLEETHQWVSGVLPGRGPYGLSFPYNQVGLQADLGQRVW
jgi:hypothetical protein